MRSRSGRRIGPGLLRSTALLCLIVAGFGSGRAGASATRFAVGSRSLGRSDRVIAFSGFDWIVKTSEEPVGPGPNYFSDDPRSAWVDRRGRLHLRIRKVGDRWLCSEVIGTRSLGYGTYVFEVTRHVDRMDPNAVLGLFTWSDDPAYHNREIDIEFSRWSVPHGPNAQYDVQPYDTPGNLHSFDMVLDGATSTHGFSWRPDAVNFRSVQGTNGAQIEAWSYVGPDIAVPEAEAPRINLWLFQGQPPGDGRPLQVIVSRFRFLPAGSNLSPR